MALTKEKLKDLFAAGEFDQYLPDPVVTWASITGKPTSMPASDVYAWAKAATKPSYAWSEIGSKPTTFPPATHTHTKANITDFPTSMPASDVYAWAKASTPDNIDLSANNSLKLAVSGGTNLLTGTDYETTTYTTWTINTASSTRSLSTNTAKFGTHSLFITRPANVASGGVHRSVSLEANQPYTFSVWAYRDNGVFNMWCSAEPSKRVSISDSYSWKRYSYTFTPSTSGNFHLYIIAQDSAAFASVYIERPQLEKGTMATDWSPAPEDPAPSAIKLTNPRTLTIGSTGKTFDGSANVSWSLTEIGAQKKITTGTTYPSSPVDGDIHIYG